MISCSNLYQDLTSTTVEFTKESIASIKSRASGDDGNCVIFATLTCGKKTQTKTVDIAEVPEANGVTLQFDKLPVGKTGTLYVSVGSKKAESDLETYYSENIADFDVETQFTVQPNGNTKIKVSLKENEENFFAQFLTFPYGDTSFVGYTARFDFTEYSTITAPLPVGTTRWSISTEDYPGQLIGSFGEKIDVKNELMKYREKFFETSGEEYNENVIQVCFEATGNPMNQIKTPIVYYNVTERVFTDEAGTPNTISMYEYLACNNIDEVQESNDAAEAIFSSPYSPVSDYCFDNAGNLYFIMDECAYKLAYDFDTNSYESAIIDNEFCSPFYSDISVQSIAYDQAQNALYLLTYDQEVANLVKFSNPAGTIYKNCGGYQSTISLDEDFYIYSTSWTVHDGIIYVSTVDNENGTCYTLNLNRYEITEEQLTLSSEKSIEIISDINAWLSNTTDLIYQDGNIYIIFKSYNTSWTPDSNGVSIGGILKYNIASKSFDESFEKKGLITENKTIKVGTNNKEISYLAPTDDDEDFYFYGPTNFVAIMPKKLVFLDQGASIDDYDYEQTNTKIPTKSRIVEYDLSTNTFSSTEITGTDLGFSFSF